MRFLGVSPARLPVQSRRGWEKVQLLMVAFRLNANNCVSLLPRSWLFFGSPRMNISLTQFIFIILLPPAACLVPLIVLFTMAPAFISYQGIPPSLLAIVYILNIAWTVPYHSFPYYWVRLNKRHKSCIALEHGKRRNNSRDISRL